MLNKIIEFSIKNKLLIGIMVIALIGYGSYQVTQLPIDAVPDITDNQVQVITIAPSYGATDIERLVTFPIEQANSNISGIKEIRSFSRFGLSLVTIVFDDKTDVYWARQQVAERLQTVRSQIPAGIGNPELGPVSTGLGEIYQYVVKPKKGYEQKYDAIELRTIQDWIIRRQLLGVKGVAEVSSFGGKLKQYEIAVNPAKLHTFGVNINDVFNALEKNNQNTGGGYIEKGPTVLYIRSEGLITGKESIENISIKSNNAGLPVFIRDIADVQIGFATRYGALCYNDEGEATGAIVMMLKGANSSEVIKNVKERIAQIQKTLPEGVEIEPFLDRTKMVNNAISTVEKNLLEGALIVVLVLVMFLGNFRAGILVASVIPLAMLFAVCMMNAFGVSGNLMSLGALDFGLIIDGAVIIVEAVMHQLTHSKKYKETLQLNQSQMDNEVSNAAGKMMNSAVFGQIIILIVYLPIFTLEGIEGKMFKPMAQTVAFALLGAFILSLTYIPMMSALFLSKNIKHTKNISDRIMEKVERFYQHLLEKIIVFPKLVLSSVVGLFVIAVITLSLLGGEFIPALEEGDFAVDTRVLTGSNLNTTIEFTQKAAHALKTKFPEVLKVVTKIGSGEVPTDPMPMEASDMMVILKDKSEWTSAETFDELAEKMGKELQNIPGITAGFQYPVQMRFNELMTGARQDVVCKIFGENLDSLAFYAAKLGAVVNTVKGSQNLYVETVTGMPQIIISYNRPLLAQYGLSVEEINRIINMGLAGQSTGLVFEDEKRYDLIVRLKYDIRTNLEDIQNLLIPTPNGIQIPLHQLATVEIKDGPSQIQREDAKRRIVVGFNVRNRDVQSIVTELQEKVNQQIHFPAGYYITYGGAFENLNKAKDRLMIAVPISLLLIFVLLYFAFNSVKQGLLIYSAIPLSAIGGIFFLALRGMPFSISAGVGFIALFGVAVLNGIVLIAEFNQLKSEGMKDVRRIVLMGTKVRLRPVLMTAFVASLGFLPMAISNGSGAEVQRPLATVVIGGLMIATLLTLFVLPILYILTEKIQMKNVTTKNTASILVLLFMSVNGFSQQQISLNDAIALALKNNQTVKLEQLKSDYANALIKTAKTIPNTSISSEFGQINSRFVDTKFSIAQSFQLPKVYKSQKQLYTASFDNTLLLIEQHKVNLEETIAQLFYTYSALKQKEQLLIKNDSLFMEFDRVMSIRLKNGESNILEKTTSELQQGNIQQQLLQIKEDIDLVLLQFQLLLNTTEKRTPLVASNKYADGVTVDSTLLRLHPNLKIIHQQNDIIQAQQQIEKSKLLPGFFVAVNNTSMLGTGADDRYYNAKYRFTSGQIGLDIPIFNKSQKEKIKALTIEKAINQSVYEKEYAQLQTKLNTAISLSTHYQNQLTYFETNALPATKKIIEGAQKQLVNGEINYLDWVMLIQQTVQVEYNYVDAIHQYNQQLIQLHYLLKQ
jgi:cobalt-zinc-cadmium resistance protein CzcA